MELLEHGKVSEECLIKNGARQGDVLAHTLFNLFLDAVINTSLQKHPESGLSILFNTEDELVGNRKQKRDHCLIPNLEYADEMCLLS